METFADKQQLSRQQFAGVARHPTTETTPEFITDAVARFAAELSGEAPVRVPVVDDPYGLYAWCSDGVFEKIKHVGGSILFGWTLWESPGLFLTAEFHAVWVNPTGEYFDITPKPNREKHILFVPDHSYPQGFDFDSRPANRRASIYAASDPAKAAADRIARMKPSQLEYESRRATKAGQSLEQWMLAKEPVDPLPNLIERFIDTCSEHEAKLDSMQSGGGLVEPDAELIQLTTRRITLLKEIKTTYARQNERGITES